MAASVMPLIKWLWPGEAARRWRRANWLLMSLLGVLGLATVGDYGMSWDEPFRFRGGDQKLAYYEAWLSGQPRPDMAGDNYPGGFDLPLAWFHKQFPEWGSRVQKGHHWSLFFGLIGLWAASRIAARLGGERAAFWALLLLATLPRYYGHMFFNPKDIPLAATTLVGLWAVVAFLQAMPRPGWRAAVLVGLAGGWALGTRIAGALVFIYQGVFALLIWGGLWWFRRRQNGAAAPALSWGWPGLLRLAALGGVSGLVGFLAVLPWWPALHGNPLDQLQATAEKVQSFHWNGPVLFDGDFYLAADLPWYYLPWWFVRTTPAFTLLLGAIAVVLGSAWLRGARKQDVVRCGSVLAVASAGVFPVVYIILTDPVLYDGQRHGLFALPPLVIIAALGLEALWRRWARSPWRRWQWLLPAGAGLAVSATALQMWVLHPYQYIYFNALSGGLPAAYQRDETDYWGLSHKAAAEWLGAYVESLPARAPDQPYRVQVRYTPWMLDYALDERFEIAPGNAPADFAVSILRINFHAPYLEAGYPILHVVEREGVPLCLVFALRPEVMPEAIRSTNAAESPVEVAP